MCCQKDGIQQARLLAWLAETHTHPCEAHTHNELPGDGREDAVHNLVLPTVQVAPDGTGHEPERAEGQPTQVERVILACHAHIRQLDVAALHMQHTCDQAHVRKLGRVRSP